ncbi:MAG: hypothetical protein R6W96_07760 [Clostridia bacterium]
MIISVKDMVELFRGKWHGAGSGMPCMDRAYSLKEQVTNEKRTSAWMDRMFSAAAGFCKDEKPLDPQDIIRETGTYMSETFSIGTGNFNLLTELFMASTKGFVAKAREYDKDIVFTDIYQALRNVWICNTIEMVAGKKPGFHDGIFGYSMLYPYSDNYLDDPGVSPEDKAAFSGLFHERLLGMSIPGEDPLLLKISDMVGMIEGRFPRKDHPGLFAALLAIHAAQVRSLNQQKRGGSPLERDILGISLEKGGTSVLVDGYLADGSLEKGLAEYCFGFGVALQLMDDLTDAREDRKAGHATIYSLAADRPSMESLVNKLINFFLSLLDDYVHLFDSEEKRGFRDTIKNASLLLIYEGIDLNRRHLGRSYLREISRLCPFRPGYYSKAKKRLNKEFRNLQKQGVDMEKLFFMLVQDADREKLTAPFC